MLTEDMLAAIAHATGDAVGVAAQRLETVRTAGLPMELFTADMASTRIRLAAAVQKGWGFFCVARVVLEDVYMCS